MGSLVRAKISFLVGAQFVHDDGALTIICNTSTHLISYILTDPRANWQKDTKETSKCGPMMELKQVPHMATS